MALMEQRLEQVAFREILRLKAQLLTKDDDDDAVAESNGKSVFVCPRSLYLLRSCLVLGVLTGSFVLHCVCGRGCYALDDPQAARSR